MSIENERWKAKYLQSLEDQEKLEKRWDTREDLLRRGLVRSSLAAEGTDKAVDQCMQELRDTLRRNDMDSGLASLIPRLEKAVLDSEHRRQERVTQVSSALGALVGQLQELPLPREISKPLKSFAKQLQDRSSQQGELPLLLSELSEFQRQALALREGEEASRPGFLQRLFGGRDDGAAGDAVGDAGALPANHAEVAPANAASAPAVEVSPVAVAAPAADAPQDATPAQAPAAVATTLPAASLAPVTAPVTASVSAATLLDSLPLPAALLREEPSVAVPAARFDGGPEFALPATPEPGYSAIAGHVETTLVGLLDELPVPERHRPQADTLRQRIIAGLNMYELVPVLDDFAVLMLAVADLGQREFEGYLKQLNERLSTFQSNLQDAHEGYADSMSAAQELDSELRVQVDGLHSSVQAATDLNSLKEVVENRLDGLLSTMDQYQNQRGELEHALSGRLQTLVERVASMEQEAKGFRDHIEEQRQKALTDTLTGLPNRAAWEERLALEMARWQRYGGELMMAVLDIDFFKRINDNYGHLAGDKVLKIIATELAKRLRKTDFIARFGGEEFVLLIPSTPLDGAQQLLDTLRTAIESTPFHFKGERVTITLSVGVSAFVAGDRAEQVFERADQALYRAKRTGRNRVEVG